LTKHGQGTEAAQAAQLPFAAGRDHCLDLETGKWHAEAKRSKFTPSHQHAGPPWRQVTENTVHWNPCVSLCGFLASWLRFSVSKAPELKKTQTNDKTSVKW